MIIITFLLVITFGYKFVGLVLPTSEKIERLSLGFLVGIGLFTFIWFLLNLVGVPFNLFSALVFLITSVILLRPPFSKPDWHYFQKMDLLEKIALTIIVGLFISSFLGGLYFPVRHWDSLTLYDFRARLMAETGDMSKAIDSGAFFGYPLLTSLSHVLVYVSGYQNPSFIYSLFYISFISAFFVNLKKLGLKRHMVLLLTLLVAVSPRIFDHSLSAYTNLPYLTYLVLGSIYLYFGFVNKSFGSLIISSVLVGLSTWTRSAEPFWLSAILIVTLLSVSKTKWLWILTYILCFVALMLPWRQFQGLYDAGSVNIANQIVSAGGKAATGVLDEQVVIPAMRFVWLNVITSFWPYVALLLLIIVYKAKFGFRNWIFVSLISLDLGLILAGTLVFVKNTPYWQEIPDSLTRMSIFIPPMVVFLLAELLNEVKKR